MSCFLFVFGQIVCARESLQTHIAGFVDFLLLCLWSTIAFTMHAVSKERIVQMQNFVFGRFSNFFFYPNETWTHPPTSNFFLDFWNFFNFAKPLSVLKTESEYYCRLLNACVRVADVMIFTFVSLMPVHNVCRIHV